MNGTDVIKVLVKLAIVALIANAGVHVGSEYLTYVKFRDAIRDAAIYKAKSDPELLSRIMMLASQYEIPLDEENITIEREDRQVKLAGWYEKPIEILPNRTYPWHFQLTLDVFTPQGPPRF